jgi:GR25 family glycosyltransferase involved in LPS biosynthesis
MFKENKINKEFEKVVFINLLSRPDKRNNVEAKFEKLGIETEWFGAVEYGFAKQIVETLPPIVNDFPRFNIKTPNEFGAAMSHYTVIKTALEQGYERLFVFEDDVMFRKDFNNQFEKSFDSLPKDWDMIMLYSFMYKIQPQNVRVNARWMKSFDAWSLMAYGMNRKTMQRYVDDMDKMFQIADRTSFKMQGKDLNIYSAVPTLCIPNQNLGSNIRGDNMNYVNTNTILNMGFDNKNYE